MSLTPNLRTFLLLTGIFAVASGAALACKPGSMTEFKTREFTLTLRPDRMPFEVPESFHYKNSTLLMSGLYEGGSFLSALEGAVVSQTPDSPEQVEKFYNEAFAARNWKIIQSSQNDAERLVMAESPYQKLVTVIMRGRNPTIIKLYHKRKNGD